jgi:hypothetical protein
MRNRYASVPGFAAEAFAVQVTTVPSGAGDDTEELTEIVTGVVVVQVKRTQIRDGCIRNKGRLSR